MSSIRAIAQSGLLAAAARLDASANNVANGLTSGFRPGRVDSAEAAGGGVTTATWRPPDPAAEARADRALVAASGTDLLGEMVAQGQAAASWRANLASLRTADELEATVLGLKA